MQFHSLPICRSAIRSSDGLLVIAGLTSDDSKASSADDKPAECTRRLLLVDRCMVEGGLECLSLSELQEHRLPADDLRDIAGTCQP